MSSRQASQIPARLPPSIVRRSPIRRATSPTATRYQNYATLRLSTEPGTFEEFRLNRRSNLAGRAAAVLIQNVIVSQFVDNHFNRMIWTILSPPSSYHFLTSDRPIIMTNGMAEPKSHLAMPIGPRTLFIASQSSRKRRPPVNPTVNERPYRSAPPESDLRIRPNRDGIPVTAIIEELATKWLARCRRRSERKMETEARRKPA